MEFILWVGTAFETIIYFFANVYNYLVGFEVELGDYTLNFLGLFSITFLGFLISVWVINTIWPN